MRPRNIQVIISNNSIVHDVLSEMELIQNESDLERYSKIDLLVVDKPLSEAAIKKIIKVTDKIINLCLKTVIENAIVFSKPFRLHNLIEVIENHQQNEAMFCLINDEILYSQKGSYVNYANEQIDLTDKENELLCALICAPNYSLTKEAILTSIWSYAKTAETSTVDIHLSRLRSRLPVSFLNIKDGYASLEIFDLK